MASSSVAPPTTAAAKLIVLTAGGTLVLLTSLGGFLGLYHGDNDDSSGWYQWLASNWMFVHGALGLVTTPLLLRTPSPSDALWISLMTIMLYTLHQWEEHAYDIYGRRYHFIQYMSEMAGCEGFEVERGKRLVVEPGNCIGLDEYFVLWINVYALFIMFFIPPFIARKQLRDFATLQSTLFAGMNALLGHILPALFKQAYNPGLIQSIFLNFPFSIWAGWHINKRVDVTRGQLFALLFVTGLPGQPLILGGPFIAMRYGILSKGVAHLFIVIAFSCLPFAGYLVLPKEKKAVA